MLANRVDLYPARIARWVARLALGEPAEAHATDPAPAEIAEPARARLLGRWHEPDLDVFVRLEPGADGRIEQPGAGGERGRFALAAGGRWYGETAGAVGIALRLDGDRLLVRPAVGNDDYGTFERAPAVEAGPAAPPTGRNLSHELDAYATFAPGDRDHRPTVTIGLTGPLPLEPAGPDVYVADGWLTLRFTDAGKTLLVSADGARRVRFNRAPEANGRVPGQIRGLR